MKKINEEFLNRELQTIIKKKNVFSTVLRVESDDGSFSWTGATGEMQADSQYFIASVTKLYVTAVVMRLIDEQKISLDDSIAKYLPDEEMRGLHVLKGAEYSYQITIRHLISNTSGLPDYFFHKQPDGQTAASRLLEGVDQSWPVEQTISTVKKLKPNFEPGKKGKAAYSDTNYQILGKIIETVTGKTMGEVFKTYIFDVLDLRNTYTYQDINDSSPVPFYYQAKRLWLPAYMASISVEGGIVSTAEEVMIFLKAFFQGRFFPVESVEQMKKWNVIPVLSLGKIIELELFVPLQGYFGRVLGNFLPLQDNDLMTLAQNPEQALKTVPKLAKIGPIIQKLRVSLAKAQLLGVCLKKPHFGEISLPKWDKFLQKV